MDSRQPSLDHSRSAESRLAWLALALILALALGLRVADLGRRPMHADEANQAVKLGQLLEGGGYRFDARDHHGPTLYYFALGPAALRGETTLARLSETTVRLTPALFGTVAVALLWLLARPLGARVAAGAALLFAVAPAAVYYSRYFVQEPLLVTFTLGALLAGRAWWRTGRRRWAVALGVCAGLMQATKASAPLFGLAALLALGLTAERPRSAVRRLAGLWPAALAALAVAAWFYSSLGTHWAGLRDAAGTYAPLGARVTGGASGHEQPWWYYAALFLPRRVGGLWWDQSAWLLLALAGAVLAWRRPGRLGRWFAVYTGLVALAHALVAYKTPWLVVHLLPGLAVLAAGAAGRLRPALGVPLLLAVVALLGGQTRQAVFLRPADARNPYAYAHTGPDLRRVPALAAAAPAGPIKVIAREYWPLPWYLRARPQVGYWDGPPAECDGPLVFAAADQADAVRARLHGTYREELLGLRPGVLLVVFTRQP